VRSSVKRHFFGHSVSGDSLSRPPEGPNLETELLKILFEDEIVILFLKNGPSLRGTR
jgi:hypothetical protein